MGLFIRQNSSRTELQERIAAELREKQTAQSSVAYEKPESAFNEGSHESQNLGPVLIVAAAIIVLGIAYLLM